jgi:hypothetical protein
MLLRVRLHCGRWVAFQYLQLLCSISLVPLLTNANLLGVFLVHSVVNMVMTATRILARPKDSVIVSLMDTEDC